MTDLVEEEKWEPGVYQLEETDPVVGGENGIDNLQAKQLGNRTQYLLAKLKQTISATLPVKVTGNVHDGFKISINSASKTAAGVVKLSDAIDSDSEETAASSAAVKKAYDNSSALVGSGLIWFLETPPENYIEINGAVLSRTAYAELFAVWGTKYGEGDGATTFGTPDSRADFLRGWDNGRGVDVDRLLGSWQEDELKSHTHMMSSVPTTYSVYDGQIDGSYNKGGSDRSYTGRNTEAEGGTETRPRNLAVMFCVRYKV